jgi:hypothetical protein
VSGYPGLRDADYFSVENDTVMTRADRYIVSTTIAREYRQVVGCYAMGTHGDDLRQALLHHNTSVSITRIG